MRRCGLPSVTCAFLGVALNGSAALALGSESALQVVPNVVLTKYVGAWYEIARYPNRHQKGLVGVVATYAIADDGTIKVANTGYYRSLDGPKRQSSATGWVVEGSNSAKWIVQFLWPFEVDYWIIDLGENYEYAVVGQPSRKNLWILCRKPKMDEATYTGICTRLREQGYDPARLQRTEQP